MPDGSAIPLLDHELADDELNWVRAVYEDFAAARSHASGQPFNPKEALRGILSKQEHQLPGPMDMTGDGPWRLGQNRQGRNVAGVFLKHVELHKHTYSRTDQFVMYVNGEADAYSEREDGQPVLTKVTGGSHYHNSPGAPHAFLPRVGEPIPDDWEIAFIAITPRNLREDTQKVSDATRVAYQQVVGREAPTRI